jgi:hydroxypyruvate isomerase
VVQFSVSLEMVFNDLPLDKGIEQAAACGAAAVEFWQWKDKDLDAITRAKEAAGVAIAGFHGLSGQAPNDPAARQDCADALLESIETARQVGAGALTVHAGGELDGLPRAKQLDALAAVLSQAAEPADGAHVMLLLEPRNARKDFPGTLLTSTDDALDVVRRVNRPNVKMLFDIYHQYITEGSVLDNIESNIADIGHFHVADVPGRGEPGTGELDFKEVFRVIGSLDYRGYVGLEFHPSGDHAAAVKSTIDLA